MDQEEAPLHAAYSSYAYWAQQRIANAARGGYYLGDSPFSSPSPNPLLR
ncbi:MAG: hypothetical protein ACI8WY_003077 [Planctomycetota bacterium]|jgi:hypothetical protein